MKFFKLVLFCLLLCSSLAVTAQQDAGEMKEVKTHEEMRSFCLEIIKTVQALSSSDEKWLTKLIDEACVCSEIEDEVENEACKNDLLTRSFGISKDAIKLDELTEEQTNRFMLLSSLSGVLGKCPEHQSPH